MVRSAAAAIATLTLAVLGWGAASAQATTVFSQAKTHGIPCGQPLSDGVRFCQGSSTPPNDNRVPSFDGTPLDVNVTLPPASGGSDGPYPLVLIPHGYGGHKSGLEDHEASWIPTSHQWAQRGYAVISYSDRGFGDSCGSASSRAAAVITAAQIADPGYAQACQQGWIKLLDTRFEVRDTQYLAGLLVDQGLVDPVRIGSVGPSYGGGMSLMLATLHDRMMNPDGSLTAWRSPNGTPMRMAGGAPTIPWSDLTYSLVPNGRTLDYAYAQPNDDRTPIGIVKQSFVAGLYAQGQATGYYAPPGADQEHDLTRWFADTNAGEPYESNPDLPFIFDQFARYRSPFHMLVGAAGSPSEPPAPLLLSNGFTDDLFPVDETVRYYNSMRALYPGVPVSLMYLDYGHMRGAKKAADAARLSANIVAWFDHYVRGDGPDPGQYVQTLTQTCPKSAPSDGPFTTGDWLSQHPGALVRNFPDAQTVQSAGGDPSVAKAIDPVASGDACATTSASDEAGTANYRLPGVVGGGYTIDGAPVVAAQMDITADNAVHSEVAARLWDVDPSGNQTLVARALYRPAASGPQVFQLHPGAWHFAAGHVPKLQLLGRDAPYGRASNAPFSLTVSNLTVFLLTRETSGNGIQSNVPLPLPPGATAVAGVKTVPLSTVIARAKPKCKAAKPKKKPKKKKARRRRKHKPSAKARSSARRHAKRKPARRKPAACTRRPARAKPRPHRRRKHPKRRTHRSSGRSAR